MKKILLIFSAISIILAGCGGCGNEVKAQTISMKTFTTGATSHVLPGATSDTMYARVSNSWRNISIQILITNYGVSAATSTFTSKIYGSLNDTNFVQIGSTSFRSDSTANPNTYIWSLANDNYLHYIVITTGNGADSATITAKLTARQATGINSVAAGWVYLTSSNVITANKGKITNLGVDTMSQAVSLGHNSVSIQTVVTKVSGTVLAGIQLQVSEDGINYTNVLGDSLHCTNVSTAQTTIWNVPASTEQHSYYRVLAHGWGAAQVATVKNYLLGK